VEDDPDQLMESAEPPEQWVVEAADTGEKPARGPYHQAIAAELIDDLALCIGQGLALIGGRENDPPEALIVGIAGFVDDVLAGKKRLTKDPTDAHLALALLYGQEVARSLGWGFAHLRRARSPGIVLVSPDRRYALGPRELIDAALSGGGGKLVTAQYERLKSGAIPEAEPGDYLRV
jgi:hypothetical protein